MAAESAMALDGPSRGAEVKSTREEKTIAYGGGRGGCSESVRLGQSDRQVELDSNADRPVSWR